MDVTKETLNYLAKIARLELNEEEKEPLLNDLNRILSFVEQLKEVNTDGVAPLLHMSSNVNMLREDVVQGSVSRDEALKNAPETDGTFFKVPKVIKK